MTNSNDWREKIRNICTYHADEGTSGYDLSEEQFAEVFELVESELKRQRDEMLENIRKSSKKLPIGIYKGDTRYAQGMHAGIDLCINELLK